MRNHKEYSISTEIQTIKSSTKSLIEISLQVQNLTIILFYFDTR